MYHAHFGLEKGLFGDGIAADSSVFRGSKHDQVIAHFKLALGSPSAALVLRGQAGIGKTTLTAATLRTSTTRLALAWLNGMPTNATELLELILVELGVNTVRTTRMERLQLWRQFQAETRATESRLFIVVERTEDLSAEVLHALDQLTAPDAVGNSGANLVLLGHPTIDEHLAAPLLESLRQRIRVRTELTAFTEAELQDYLRHQVACAGGHFDRIFAPGTVAALYRYSAGVARLANTLCETALDHAASQQQKLLTAEAVTKTATSLLGLGEAAPALRAAAPTPPSRETAPVATPRPPVAVAPVVATALPIAAPTIAVPATVVATTVAPPATVAVATFAAAPAMTPTPLATAIPATVYVTPAQPQNPATARASTPAPVPAPVAPAARAPTPTPAPVRAPVAPAARVQAPTSEPTLPAIEFEFDGGSTDITDVAMADFPVLTDAVESPAVATPAKRPSAPTPLPQAAAPTPVAKPAPAQRAAAPLQPAKPAAAAASRVETAYTAAKAPPAAPPAPKPAAAATPKPAAPPRTPVSDASEDDDLLRQTQTMRAIAVARSIDDISSSMAETLFGDAELDLVTAALASAAEWPDDDAQPAPAASRSEPTKSVAKPEPAPAKAQLPADDPFDLFGLGDDAPLELIDDSTLPPIDQSRKRAAR